MVADDAPHAPAYGDLLPRNPDDGSHSLVRSSLDVDDRAVFQSLFHAYLSWLTYIYNVTPSLSLLKFSRENNQAK